MRGFLQIALQRAADVLSIVKFRAFRREGDAVGKMVGADACSDQLFEMCATAEFLTQIVADRSDVGALGAIDIECQVGIGVINQGCFNRDRSSFSFCCNALAGELIEFFAALLFGGKHRRHLHDGSLKVVQGLLDLIESWNEVGLVNLFAIDVVGIGFDAKMKRCAVGFIVVL